MATNQLNWQVDTVTPVAAQDLSGVDLETILAAWHTATDRLQRTHEVLSMEVRRLNDELEIKNRELARENRLADLGRAAAHVAHEVRNSLVPLTLDLSLLKRKISPEPSCLELIAHLEKGFTDVETTVNDMLTFTADRDLRCATFDVAELLGSVLESLSAQFAAQQIHVELDMPLESTITADPDMLRRAVLNLVLNAVDVMPQGGSLTIGGYPSAAGFELEIADSGPGVSEAALQQLFDPFFTTKGNGSGLGLAIVTRIAEAHHGGVTVANCPQGGAAFTLFIPALDRSHCE